MIEDNGYKAKAGSAEELAGYCITLLEDAELWKKFSEKSFQIVKKYDVRKLTDNLEAIYVTTMKHGPRRK